MVKDSRVRPLEAAQGVLRLIRDPNATEEAFRVVRALEGNHVERLLERTKSTAGGRRLLAERPDLLETLSDRERLSSMPEGSLGRTYVAFCERNGISPGGLVEASESDERERLSEEELFIADRLRESHDLWHTVTGYNTDLSGENALLAFTASQTGSAGVFFLAAAGYVSSWLLQRTAADGRQLTRDAWKRGKRAAWLPEVYWEELLHRPLDEVRSELGLEDVPDYEPVYPEDLITVAA